MERYPPLGGWTGGTMKESLAECVRELQDAVKLLPDAVELHHWEAARELCRRVLSAGSKLHARVGLLGELMDEADWAAQVDRAVRRGTESPPVRLPGDVPLPFDDAPPASTPGKGKPRTRKGE